jgi:Polyketide cyclase / dehydrase and lipid transport
MTGLARVLLAMAVVCGHPLETSPTEKGRPMHSLHEVRHVSVSIARPPGEVYAFASKPENLPRWASGAAGTIQLVNGEWIADGPAGKARIRFVERNALGVLDHDVVLESGATIHVPIRVIPNGTGSEVVVTLVRQPDASDERFAADARWVEKDLNALKALLER